MDLGEPFKCWMTIEPALGRSFIVTVAGPDGWTGRERRFGFTTIDDLLIWMARHGTKAHITELKEGDVVGGEGTGANLSEHALQQRYRGALSGLKRTTAAEIIREREARGKTLAERIAAAETFVDRVAAAEAVCADADRPSNDAA